MTATRSRDASSLSPSTRHRNSPNRQLTTARRFSGTRIRRDGLEKTVASAELTAQEIEAVVIQARQTFGETLPKDYLSAEEYILYERLYGPPLRDTRPEDLEYLPDAEEDMRTPEQRNLLLRDTEDGYEEVEMHGDLTYTVSADELARAAPLLENGDFKQDGDEGGYNELKDHDNEELMVHKSMELEEPNTSATVIMQGKNQRERDAIAQLQREMPERVEEAPDEEGIEDVDEEEYVEQDDWEDDHLADDGEDPYWQSDPVRTHPNTLAGRSGTNPTTLFLPQDELVGPVTELLARTNRKHLTTAAENAFGGKGLPYSASVPRSKKHLPQKQVGLDAAQRSMSEVEADAYITAVMPGTYASVMHTLVEVRKRLGKEWIHDMIFRQDGQGPRVLDAGAGGAGIIAWREILQAEWDTLKGDGAFDGDDIPSGKTTVLTGPDTLRHRVSRFLENTTFIPRLPDNVHASDSVELIHHAFATTDRKKYDLIIAPHTLFPLKEEFKRKNLLKNLWSLLDPNGGVLVLIEKGIPRGFEAIAGARDYLLQHEIASPGEDDIVTEVRSSSPTRFARKEPGMIIAPCTNHKACPMYPVPGLSSGRKDFCHFGQRYIRPPYLQQVLGASQRNHEDIKFSYIAVRKGLDAREELSGPVQNEATTDRAFEGFEDDVEDGENVKFNTLSLPRSILPPLKRRGHVTLDLCTPAGKLERWTVPKSFSKTAYRDARKSRWGDLWALGAKTRVPRSPRLGQKFSGDGDVASGKKGEKKSMKNKANKFDMVIGKDGRMEGIEIDKFQARKMRSQPQKRNKKGRKLLTELKPLSEDDLG
ncbi:mitochondrial small ribosomal subunit Rsm22-domain-containing protein [Calycina marina]|uniref:Mitochondrial small ribosomal subunit Rsm22-domain-containing protein n=1 Tax=Calycina marina TaxID=1763456 RepID=A0A9P7YYT7_9HELO|nr:mitochondrial small ribosomal subunit Rsm22-domain-containing protein [Calycina marina]